MSSNTRSGPSAGAEGDFVFGEDGNDNMVPGLDADAVEGGAGSDSVNYIDITPSYGVPGVSVTLGTNSVSGGAGADTLVGVENATGSPQADTLIGDAGANTLLGAAGDDNLSSGDGNDFLRGSAGADSSTGGNGNDILAPGTGDDPTNDGGAGTDTVTYISEPVASGVNVNLATGAVTGGPGPTPWPTWRTPPGPSRATPSPGTPGRTCCSPREETTPLPAGTAMTS